MAYLDCFDYTLGCFGRLSSEGVFFPVEQPIIKRIRGFVLNFPKNFSNNSALSRPPPRVLHPALGTPAEERFGPTAFASAGCPPALTVII